MIAVVTGSSGFIGRNLVERLLRDGHTVRCLLRSESGRPPAGCERYVVDYQSRDSLLSTPALAGAGAIFHMAGATIGARARDYHRANVAPTTHLLGAIAERHLDARFVLVSSQAAAGPAASLDRPVDETHVPAPIEEYGRSKLAAERLVESHRDSVRATIVRPCAVYGPGDRDFLTLFRFARRGWIVYPGVRRQWLSVLHVDDVVAGLVLAATSDRALGRTYFLAPENPVQWTSIGAAVASAAGRSIRELDLPAPLVAAASLAGDAIGRVTGRALLANRNKAALARPAFWVCTAARARSELGFAERRALPEAIRDTYLWYEANGWLGGSKRSA